jgi:tRNA G46 methylase TrmB
LTDATLSVDIVGVEFNRNGLSDYAAHISGLRGDDGRIVELNAVFLVDTVFRYGRLVRMF